MANESLKDKLLRSAKKDTTWKAKAEERMRNEKWQDLSFAIATRILSVLKEKGMTQLQLAEKLGVSPQMVNKMVRGNENMTLETISRISEVISTELIEVPALPIKVSRPLVSHSSRMGIVVCDSYRQTQNIRKHSFMVIGQTEYKVALHA